MHRLKGKERLIGGGVFMGEGDESWHDDVGMAGDRAMPARIGSVPGQNPLDFRKVEGEEVGDLPGSEVVP